MVPHGSMVNGFIYSDKCKLHKFSVFVCDAQAVEALRDSMCHRKKALLRQMNLSETSLTWW